MEPLNRKPLGICLILIFGLMLFSTIIGIFTAFMLNRFDIIDWYINNNIRNVTNALFKLLYLAAFIFTGINRKWFTNPIGQVSTFVLAALSLFYFFYNLYYLFNSNSNLFPPITECSIELFTATLKITAWTGLFLTLRTGLVVKIMGLISEGILFLTSISSWIIVLLFYTGYLSSHPFNILYIIDGTDTISILFFIPVIIICVIVWMRKSSNHQLNY